MLTIHDLLAVYLLLLLSSPISPDHVRSSREAPFAVVFWHGMNDYAGTGAIKTFERIVKQAYPGTYVKSIATSSSRLMDIIDSFLKPIDKQLEQVCEQLKSDANLTRGMHLIGISQGGLFVRGLVQRCPGLKIGSVVSIGGPQQGVDSVPQCETGVWCSLLRRACGLIVYNKFIQILVQAQYWHDTFNPIRYKANNRVLADLNQENTVNETYKTRMLQIKNLVLVQFEHDTMVIPKQSEWFGFYKQGTDKQTIDLYDTALYKEDRLGLKTLNESGRLKLISTPGNHLQFSYKWFRETIVPFLG